MGGAPEHSLLMSRELNILHSDSRDGDFNIVWTASTG